MESVLFSFQMIYKSQFLKIDTFIYIYIYIYIIIRSGFSVCFPGFFCLFIDLSCPHLPSSCFRFAYIEFSDKESVRTAMALDSLYSEEGRLR